MNARRIVQCVNAMAGVKDPERLMKAIQEIDAMSQEGAYVDPFSLRTNPEIQELLDALYGVNENP